MFERIEGATPTDIAQAIYNCQTFRSPIGLSMWFDDAAKGLELEGKHSAADVCATLADAFRRIQRSGTMP